MTGESLPVTLGHEFCGRVSPASPAPALRAAQLRPGDAVVADPRHYCRACTACRAGNTNVCDSWGFRGLSGGGGGLAERCAVRSDLLHRVPDAALASAAVVEPLAVVWRASGQAGVADFAAEGVGAMLILGGGPIGAALLLVLRARGARTVFVSEPAAGRRVRLQGVADVLIDPVAEDLGSRCRELTGGRGVDVVFDAAGAPAALGPAFDALALHGTYVNVALWEKPMVVPQGPYLSKEITMKASMAYNDDDFRETVEAFTAGRFPGAENLITGRIALEDVTAKGFDELINNREAHVKILVTPKQLSSSTSA